MEELKSPTREQDNREKEEKFYWDRKKMIFNKIGKKRHLIFQSKQNTIKMHFAPEVPEDIQMDILKDEEFHEVPGKRIYARDDQQFKKKEIKRAGKSVLSFSNALQTELSKNTLLLLSTAGACKSPMQQKKGGLYL